MKRFFQYGLLVVCLSLLLAGSAHSQAAIPPGSVKNDGDGVIYDQRLGAPISLKETIAGFKLPVASMLPEAIPAVPMVEEDDRPLIAVVVDDMGIDRKKSARAVQNLDPAVTVSYLPYAKQVQEQVDSAKAAGHEVMLHLPWQADNLKADPGPNHLGVNMSKAQIRKNLQLNLDAFKGYTGVNNHMGSKFSKFRPGVEVVMAELKKRGLFFLDSKTIPSGVAEKVAREYGIDTTHRDVFLDHEENPGMVGSSLHEVEALARRKGSAIAIGHPKDLTLAALESWLPTLAPKGFRLVPLTEVLAYRQKIRDAHVASGAK